MMHGCQSQTRPNTGSLRDVKTLLYEHNPSEGMRHRLDLNTVYVMAFYFSILEILVPGVSYESFSMSIKLST